MLLRIALRSSGDERRRKTMASLHPVAVHLKGFTECMDVVSTAALPNRPLRIGSIFWKEGPTDRSESTNAPPARPLACSIRLAVPCWWPWAWVLRSREPSLLYSIILQRTESSWAAPKTVASSRLLGLDTGNLLCLAEAL